MKSFVEWFDGNRRTLYEDEKWVAKKAWDARQAEVDTLQAEIDELQAMYEKQGLYAFELQKRLDEAWNELDDRYSKEYIIERIENILKGNQDAG